MILIRLRSHLGCCPNRESLRRGETWVCGSRTLQSKADIPSRQILSQWPKNRARSKHVNNIHNSKPELTLEVVCPQRLEESDCNSAWAPTV